MFSVWEWETVKYQSVQNYLVKENGIKKGQKKWRRDHVNKITKPTNIIDMA